MIDDPRWIERLLGHWEEGQRLGAVGPGPVARQFEHAKALAEQLPSPNIALDLGSGAGVPGLALAGLWPASRWVLVDAAARRVRLLERAIVDLGWSDRVEAYHGRAEDLARTPELRGRFGLVVARSFGPPAVTAECGAGFVADGGLLVVTEPRDDAGDRWSAEALEPLSLTPLPSPPSDRVAVQRLQRQGELPEWVPRRAGRPAKRPLFG